MVKVKRLAKPVILARYLPTIFFILLIALAYFVIKPFLMTVIFALILAYILNPLYSIINSKIKNSTISALLMIILLAVLLTLGGFYFVNALVKEAKAVFLQLKVSEIGPEGLDKLLTSPYIKPMVENATLKIINAGTQFLVSIPLVILNIVIMLFVLFYAFKEKDISRNVLDMLPLSEHYKESLYNEVKKTSKLVLYGFIVIGFIQGIIGGLAFFAFGVPNPLFWTVVMIVASILPLGPWLVWIPAVIFKFLSAQYLAALGLAIFGAAIVNNVDLFIRPLLVGKKAGMHPLVILIGGTGGILAFGPLGLIIGPLIIAFTIAFLKVYRDEQNRLHVG